MPKVLLLTAIFLVMTVLSGCVASRHYGVGVHNATGQTISETDVRFDDFRFRGYHPQPGDFVTPPGGTRYQSPITVEVPKRVAVSWRAADETQQVRDVPVDVPVPNRGTLWFRIEPGGTVRPIVVSREQLLHGYSIMDVPLQR